MRGGTYLAMEGPQFSTKAESNMYRSWGCDVIGMTNIPEAKLAREAEIPYCTIAMVTDYDCWHPHFGAVNVENIGQVLRENAEKGKALIKCIAKKMQGRPPRALKSPFLRRGFFLAVASSCVELGSSSSSAWAACSSSSISCT